MLLKDDYFEKAKSVRETIDEADRRYNVKLRSSEVSGSLLFLCKKKILKVTKLDGRNFYENAKK